MLTEKLTFMTNFQEEKPIFENYHYYYYLVAKFWLILENISGIKLEEKKEANL